VVVQVLYPTVSEVATDVVVAHPQPEPVTEAS